MTLEAQTIARACGKSHVHKLEPEDLVALTIEAAAMAACRWPARTGSPEAERPPNVIRPHTALTAGHAR